jgi:hypothetical protein
MGLAGLKHRPLIDDADRGKFVHGENLLVDVGMAAIARTTVVMRQLFQRCDEKSPRATLALYGFAGVRRAAVT